MENETDDNLTRPEPQPAKVFSAPRRFDLATIFTVTLAYAILFALMSLVGASVVVSVCIAGFVTLVGAGQAVLFGGKRPRAASIVCGVGSSFVVILGMAIWDGRSAPLHMRYVVVLVLLTYTVLGGVLGYFAGVFVGGVFLVSEAVRSRAKRWRDR